MIYILLGELFRLENIVGALKGALVLDEEGGFPLRVCVCMYVCLRIYPKYIWGL